MRVVIQRSLQSNVKVNEAVVGEISSGMVLLVCLEEGDSIEKVKKAADKILKLRIFSDQLGKMNWGIKEAGGEILAISQFTLSWSGEKGNRPSFDKSMEPKAAEKLFNDFCALLRIEVKVETGQFGADMHLSIQNNGPVTFSLEF